MMKQPSENPNATPLEEKRSAERAMPNRDPAEEYAEIEEEVRRMSSTGGSDDWNRAAEIVRNRKTSRSKA